jgi:4a-hydroxytetrahydrobiopterin dehydratase
MPILHTLLNKQCQHQTCALTPEEISGYLKVLPNWKYDGNDITRVYSFKNYYDTLAFINAISYLIHKEDHHPIIILTYQHCRIKFITHSVNDGQGGISENDFICAAKIEAFFQLY